MALSEEEKRNHLKRLKKSRLICSFKFDDGRRCGLLSVVGQNVCARHGAALGYAAFLGSENTLSGIYTAFHLREDKLDLTGELALQRTFLSAILTRLKDRNLDAIKEGTLYSVTDFVNSVIKEIGRTVKTISEVENQSRDSIHVLDIKMVIDSMIEILYESGVDTNTLGAIAEKMDQLALPVGLSDQAEIVDVG